MTMTDSALTEVFNSTARKMVQSTPHGSRGVERVNLSVDASSSDIELANNVRQMFYTAKAHRKPMVAKWNKSYRMLRGRYWDANGRANWMPSPSVPEIFPIIRSIVGWTTDRRFHHTVGVASAPFTQFQDYYAQLALDLETVLDSTWHVNKEESQVTTALWDAYTYGTGILKTTWDNTLAGGMGDAKISRVDPYGFYPDPAARDLESCNYIIEVKQMSLQELDRRFPGTWDKFRHGGISEAFDEAPSQMQTGGGNIPRANPAAISPATSARYGRPGGPSQLSGAKAHMLEDEGVTVFECWVREHEFYTTTISDPEEGEVEEEHVFDTWRVIVVAGEHILLNEKAEDIWSHGQHPYSRYVPYDLGEFWGISMVELLTSSQETINRMLASAVQNIELVGNPILVEDQRAGTSRQQLQNRPGLRVTKNQGGNIAWMEPPRIDQDIPNFLQYFLQRMETVSGLSAINRGSTPTGRNSQGVVDSVQESAFVGIRMALRQLEYTLRDAGYKKASLIVENYTVPRMCAIVGPGGQTSTLALRGRHFMIPNGEMRENTPMDYTLLIDAGANTDTSRKVREDKAITLFTLGGLDIYSLLEALEWPHREQVMERIQQGIQAGTHNPPGQRQRAGH